ncbi:hypothetical protein IGB42_03079 [Andreprevotia sp. IGB-42]|uniref:hypothetical protein n=1 Tax=Andreprevotia sp. IGB-42 TaxID=2497473 RepID=UPI00135C0838|nr:hypothetical protein [Andreprevotia sp. IGB-42]KAF0812411.1 hypothetical protein IGB42_03079 [Andreprevotia sp. IGB-42]
MIGAGEFVTRINNGSFLRELFSSEQNWDAMLDARDSPCFDAAWCAAFAAVQPDGAESSLAKEVRETVFKEVLQLTGHAELAGYASDDFSLIIATIERHQRNDFVEMLWHSYLSRQFPH